jgi:D-beta-D-heptose 7-phosphate kinase/D-beta-D-heptose 1-phosphate adenosyltransferase
LVHPGHIALLQQAAEHCDRLIVALNSDSSVRTLKGPTRPIQNEQARAVVMGAIRGVSSVVIFEQETPHELFKTLQPDVIFKGSDYTEDQVVGADIVKARAGRVVLIDLVADQSTSKLVKAGNLAAKVEA